jgi:hypothetical protein
MKLNYEVIFFNWYFLRFTKSADSIVSDDIQHTTTTVPACSKIWEIPLHEFKLKGATAVIMVRNLN